MATVTWDGSTDTDYGTAANWDTGSVPTSSDDVIIANVSNDCVLDGTRSVNSFVVQAGGDFNGNTEMLTVVGENGAGFAVDIDGDIIGTTTNITITTAATTAIDFNATAGNVRHLTVNHASCVINSENSCELSGNLTITAGNFNANGNALTVAGATTIGDGSASADTSTLTCGSSAVSLGTGVTGTHSLVVDVGGTFVGGSGTHTLGSLNIKNSTAAKCTLTSGVTTIDGEGAANKAINIEGSNGVTNFAHGSGTVTITHDGASDIKADGVTLALNNLIINHASANINLKGILTCAGNLTITAGELDTDSSNFALTVTGQCLVNGGTLTLNGSTCDFGDVALSSGTINGNTATIDLNTGTGGGWVWYQTGGTWNHNTSTVVYKTTGKHIQSNSFYNLTIECAADTNTGVWRDMSGNTLTIANDLTVKEGHFRRDSVTDIMVVTGDVSIESGGKLGNETTDNVTGADTFGSLTIASGGTAIATSGTTTITSETSDYALNNAGTFTHNNGKFKLEGSNDTRLLNSTYYDLEISMSAAGKQVDLYDSSGSAIDILGDLTVTTGRLTAESTSDALTVHGLTNIAANGTCWYDADSDTNKITHHGLVTNLGAYRINDGTTVKLNGGIRQLGTLTIT